MPMYFRADFKSLCNIIFNAIVAAKPNSNLTHTVASLEEKPSLTGVREHILTRFNPTHDGLDPIDMGYYAGRQIKITFKAMNQHDRFEGSFDAFQVVTSGAEPDPEYQSWASTYPTWRALIESGGGEWFTHDDRTPWVQALDVL